MQVLSRRQLEEFLQNCLVETLAHTVRLRRLYLGFGLGNIVDSEEELMDAANAFQRADIKPILTA